MLVLHLVLVSIGQFLDYGSSIELSGRGRGMLYPHESESRQIQLLDGMWNFKADASDCRCEGLTQQWYLKKLSETGVVMPMPVPSSFNDITTDTSLQNFVGWVWYDRMFYVADEWKNKCIVLRIDSAHYNAIVWVNGMEVMTHSGGHLPFEATVNYAVSYTAANRITVAINNMLTPYTLPPGSVTFYSNHSHYPPGYFVQDYQFDFFNYAGIHRHVLLYTTPLKYIDDITVNTKFTHTHGYVEYTVSTVDTLSTHKSHQYSDVRYRDDTDPVTVQVLDVNGTTVSKGTGATGILTINNVQLWWPYTMNNHNPPYLYTLQVLYASDVYRLPFGVRTVEVNASQILINGHPFYCLGIGKHEDADIRGRGLDLAMIARDFQLMKWLGANCFRTSHYPYAEQVLQQADQMGFVIIDESPAVGLVKDENFSNKTLSHHLRVMTELVIRDKNHPSVVMWSVANEPKSTKSLAQDYFKRVIEHTRGLDATRPVTFVMSGASSPFTDKAAKYTDVTCINRYYAWYQDTGQLQTIAYKLSSDLMDWYQHYQRPIIVTEYGAGAVSGLHALPSVAFSEDFQMDFLQHYHVVFDEFRHKFLAGEMVWNFADFMTQQSVNRVLGNRKGLFTRQRQPKMSAYLIRRRYCNITQQHLPSD